MIAGAKYGHTNLIAKDWRALARFYEEQFGCTPVPPERDYKGADLERGTAIPGAELKGAHLRLFGHGAEGPVGKVVTLTTATGSRVTWVYVTDPEGNVIELQSWSK